MRSCTTFDPSMSWQEMYDTGLRWETRARDAEEERNGLLNDLTGTRNERNALAEKVKTLEADNASLKAEFTDTAANAQRLAEAGDQLVVDIEEWMQSNHHCPGSAYRIGQWRKALDAKPAESLARLKAEWQYDLLGKARRFDLHTNNGELRHDAERRAGWNACLEELHRQAEGGE